jgi:hypothetical protein
VTAQVERRNSFWYLFATSGREKIVNVDEQAPEAVAIFRYRYSLHLGDPDWLDFVHRLSAASPLFARLWATHDVAPPRPCDKVFRFPAIGDIALRSTNLDVATQPGHRLVVYVPIDEASRQRIALLRASRRGGPGLAVSRSTAA